MAVAGRSTNEIGRMRGLIRLSVQKYAAYSLDNDFIITSIIITLTFKATDLKNYFNNELAALMSEPLLWILL